jgi:predicted esterase
LDGLLGKIEVIWQKPEQPKGVLLLFHGCGGTATSFFPKTDACQNCTGRRR